MGGDDEENERMMTFLTNRQRVRRHNEAYERGEKSFRLELNHLADLVSVQAATDAHIYIHLIVTRRISQDERILAQLR